MDDQLATPESQTSLAPRLQISVGVNAALAIMRPKELSLTGLAEAAQEFMRRLSQFPDADDLDVIVMGDFRLKDGTFCTSVNIKEAQEKGWEGQLLGDAFWILAMAKSGQLPDWLIPKLLGDGKTDKALNP